MTSDSRSRFDELQLPQQDLASLRFCASKANKVRDWAEALPATRISFTSAQLYKALPEITRLQTSAEERLEMLESLRPYVQHCIKGLAKVFFNQPITLSEQAMKAAIVAQALQKHLSAGYAVAALELEKHPKITKKNDLRHRLALALHRTITGTGLLLLRCYQLYTPAPPQQWLSLHLFYRLADERGLLHEAVADPLLREQPSSQIRHAYLRMLLLASANPNQIRQTELLNLYRALEFWTPQVQLSENLQQPQNLYVVNQHSDTGPIYKAQVEAGLDDPLYELDLCQLLTTLDKQQLDHSKQLIKIPSNITPTLLQHCIGNWSTQHQRHHERQPTSGQLEMILGLTSLHFHLSQGQEFQQFIQLAPSKRHNNPFCNQQINAELDPWADAFDAEQEKQMVVEEINFEEPVNSAQQLSDKHPIFTTPIVDISPGGYCIDWSHDIPIEARVGEVAGLRERGRQDWSIGIIRWVRQSRGHTQLGMQLLGIHASPFGGSMIQVSGENSDYMRVLQLPENKALQQPASLLTAIYPFREHGKVKLKQHGQTTTVQLTRRLVATSAVSLFSYRTLEATDTEEHDNAFKDSDSQWNS